MHCPNHLPPPPPPIGRQKQCFMMTEKVPMMTMMVAMIIMMVILERTYIYGEFWVKSYNLRHPYLVKKGQQIQAWVVGCSYILKIGFDLMPARTPCPAITRSPQKISQAYISIFDRLHYCFVLGFVLMPSRKHFKSKAIPSILGDVGLIKVVLKFSSGHPKCHFWARKDGHFCQDPPLPDNAWK